MNAGFMRIYYGEGYMDMAATYPENFAVKFLGDQKDSLD